MSWSVDDAKDALAIAEGTAQIIAAVKRLRDRHRADTSAPALLREAHIEEEANHIVRDIHAVKGYFGGDTA